MIFLSDFQLRPVTPRVDSNKALLERGADLTLQNLKNNPTLGSELRIRILKDLCKALRCNEPGKDLALHTLLLHYSKSGFDIAMFQKVLDEILGNDIVILSEDQFVGFPGLQSIRDVQSFARMILRHPDIRQFLLETIALVTGERVREFPTVTMDVICYAGFDEIRGFSGLDRIYINVNAFTLWSDLTFVTGCKMDLFALILHETAHMVFRMLEQNANISTPNRASPAIQAKYPGQIELGRIAEAEFFGKAVDWSYVSFQLPTEYDSFITALGNTSASLPDIKSLILSSPFKVKGPCAMMALDMNEPINIVFE